MQLEFPMLRYRTRDVIMEKPTCVRRWVKGMPAPFDIKNGGEDDKMAAIL